MHKTQKLKTKQHEPQNFGWSLVLRKGKQIFHTRKKEERIVVTTLRTYSLSSVKRIYHNGKPTHDGVRKTCEGMISTSPLGTLGLITSLWAETLYQGNHDMKYKPLNIVSTERFILRMQALLECCYIKIESSQLGTDIFLFFVKFCFQRTLIVIFYMLFKIWGRLNCIYCILYLKFDRIDAFNIVTKCLII